MHPLLLDLGAWQITSYGAALALAFALGIGLGVLRAPRYGLAAEPVLGVSIVIIVASLVGSRLFFLLNPPAGAGSGGGDAWTGTTGLSVMGGLPTALVCSALYLRWRGLPVAAYMDLLAPSVAFGAAVTRIGCFANGCCHGIACDWPWAVRFPAGSLPHAALGDVAVHPTQLYQSLAGLVIGAGLVLLARRKPPAGSVLFALIGAWGVQRGAVELFRHHSGGEIWFRLGGSAVSVYQGVALALVAVGGVGWILCTKHWKPGARV